MLKLADADAAVRVETLKALAKTGDLRVEAFFDAYRLGSVYLWNGRLVVCDEIIEDDDFNRFAPLSDVLNHEPLLKDGQPLAVPIGEVQEVSPNRKERKLAAKARFLLRLSSPDREIRMSGVKKCGDPPVIADAIEPLQEIAEQDPDEKIRHVARESLLLIQLDEARSNQDREELLRLSAELGSMKSMRALPRLQDMVNDLEDADEGGDLALQQTCVQSIETIGRHQRSVDRFASVFQGLSLGSVLILMALGLAITFGLMGVINMAHGEFMMIGAYATYEIQLLFMRFIDAGTLPAVAYDWYYVAAFPAAFLCAAFVGYLVEILVVRHLYRRPLESLLATWGVGLILIQMVRLRYGDNIGVSAPQWARGGIEIMQDVILPYSRCFIIVLCALCVLLIYYLLARSTIGLRMRATMQQRGIAKSLGVNTERVDRLTFAFGTGIAGIAGYGWTLIGGVTPDMGQKNFIVDSFLVVVTGGVGELMGVIFSGLGIGLLTKFIEPLQIGPFVMGAIWAKVLLLIIIVAFIQFKPSGLFAPKGRLADV
jgi:urea transport system permease protein